MAVLRTLLVSLVLVAAGIGVLAGATDGFRAFTTETARRIAVREHPRVVPSLPLQTADGGRTRIGALHGRWVLVDFIYTRCETYCSVQGGEFARLQRQLAHTATEVEHPASEMRKCRELEWIQLAVRSGDPALEPLIEESNAGVHVHELQLQIRRPGSFPTPRSIAPTRSWC